MRKKCGFIFMMLAIALVLSGCTMKMNVGLDVKKDGKVTAKIISAMDNEMIDAMISMSNMGEDENDDSSEITDKERWEYLEKDSDDEGFEGYKKEKYDKDGLKGYIYTKELGNIDDLSADKIDDVASMEKLDENSKIFVKTGDTYTLKIASDSDYKEESSQYSESGATFDIKFEVTLPNKAIKSNATSVKGNTYTWDLLKADNIELEFDLKGGSNLLLICLIVAGVAVVGAALFFVLRKKNK